MEIAIAFISGFVLAILILFIFVKLVINAFTRPARQADFSSTLASLLNEIEDDQKDQPEFFVYTPDGMAYWLQDDAIYCAEIVGGEVNLEEGKPVDLNNLSGEALDDILLIMETLRKGDKK